MALAIVASKRVLLRIIAGSSDDKSLWTIGDWGAL
jgi:hypothetical protein